jgi:hypothetical protein
MWLLVLLIIVFVITVFLLGTYSAKANANLTSTTPYPSKEEKERNHKSCSGLTTSASSCDKTPEVGSCNSKPARVDEDDKPCKKHRKRHCHVCYKIEDDGFSHNGLLDSMPAPF